MFLLWAFCKIWIKSLCNPWRIVDSSNDAIHMVGEWGAGRRGVAVVAKHLLWIQTFDMFKIVRNYHVDTPKGNAMEEFKQKYYWAAVMKNITAWQISIWIYLHAVNENKFRLTLKQILMIKRFSERKSHLIQTNFREKKYHEPNRKVSLISTPTDFIVQVLYSIN